MKRLYNPARAEWPLISKRPNKDLVEIESVVSPVFEEVRRNGDLAVKKYTLEFDHAVIDELEINHELIDKASTAVPEKLKLAIQQAYSNIYNFHKAQQTEKLEVETTKGVRCWQEKRPIEKVGLYIPGGTAPLFSTVLMLAIPAKIAGCKKVVLCTPPDSKGEVNPAILYTAGLCGIDKIYRVGGIQAIAALTFGTDTIPKVYKIFGPGNQYVTAAKQMATRYDVAIDLPAGPSELLVLADKSAVPAFVASDLLSQAEHGTDSQVILVTTDEAKLDEIEDQLRLQLDHLPRKAIAEVAISNSKLIFMENEATAADFINEYGPEHYIINSENEDFFIDRILNAGSVFVGPYTPESAGDYASGTNHTLPTKGFAKQYSGVNLDSFLKSITFQHISDIGLQNIGETVEILAEAEGMFAHRNAVSLRLKSLNKTR